jgi:hypothetical protein
LPDSKPSPNKTRVIELLRCPINWSELAPGCPVVDELEYYWMVVATGCLKTGTGDFDGVSMEEPTSAVYLQSTEARDADLDYYERLTDSERENLREVLKAYAEAEGETLEVFFSPFFLNLETEEELEEELPQIEAWIERSRRTYQERMHRFEKMEVADDVEYRKHFPAPNQPTAKIRVRSRRGISYFYKGVTRERLRTLWWDVLWHCWGQLLNGNKAVLYVDAGTAIGSSFGEDTRYMKLIVDLSTPRVHAYPIPEKDIPKDVDLIRSSELIGCIEMI